MKKNTFPNVSKSVGRRYFYTQWKECQVEQNFKDPFNKMNQNLKIMVFSKVSLDLVFFVSVGLKPRMLRSVIVGCQVHCRDQREVTKRTREDGAPILHVRGLCPWV